VRGAHRFIVIAALLALCALALAFDTLLMSAMIEKLQMNDFGKFYYSARAFLEGRDMYAPSPATNLRFEEAPDLQMLNMNPPHFHALVLPFAVLQPARAVALWMGVSLFALMLSLLLIVRELRVDWTPTRLLATVLGVLAFAGTQTFFVTGQLSMLLLLAITICWLKARRGRWSTAGAWLGACISVKPFLLIFVAYLLGARRFRALAVALVTVALCFAAGLLVFGVGAYQSWYRALGQSGDWAWTAMNASTFGFFRRAFDVQPIVTPLVEKPQLVKFWMPAAGLIGLVTLAAAFADRTASATDRAFALLLVAATLMSPLGWIYYVTLAAGPVAALALRPRRERQGPLSRALVAGCIVGFAWPLPLVGAFQPHRWATLVIASMYFWATLSLWIWLVIDYARSRSEAPV
jgi:alpha-1,2-mannosyltransferase